MGLTEFLKKTSGQIKSRGATAIGALRTTRIGRVGVAFARRTPVGLAITAAQFRPQIVRGVRVAGRFVRTAFGRAIGFLGGTKVGAAVGGGALAGGLVSIFQIPGLQTDLPVPPGTPPRPPAAGENGKAPKPPRKPNGFKSPKQKEIDRKRAAAKRKAAARRGRRKAPKPRRGGAHKARIVPGLDIAHKRKKKGISLKTIRASIASPRTPPQLKKGLRRLLRQRSAHKHKKRGRR